MPIPTLKSVADFRRSQIFPYVQALEREHGLAKIYDSPFRFAGSDADLQNWLFHQFRPMWVEMKGTKESAETFVRDTFSMARLEDMIYQPASLRWAHEVSRLFLGNYWPQVANLFVVPVSIPLFNASVSAWAIDQPVVLFHLGLIHQIAFLHHELIRAQQAWFKNDGPELVIARAKFQANLQSAIRAELFGEGEPPRFDVFSFGYTWALTCLSILFVLLHEFAHLVLGHLSPDDATRPTLGGYSVSQQKELEADNVAVNWLIGVSLSSISEHDRACDGPLLWISDQHSFVMSMALVHVFTIFYAMEREARLIADTHPPAMDRLLFALQVLNGADSYRETVKSATELAGFYRKFVDNPTAA